MFQIHVRREVHVCARSVLSVELAHDYSSTDFDMLSPEVLPTTVVSMTLSPSMLITIVQDLKKSFALSRRLPTPVVATVATPARPGET
jgi:hypothetical protein